MPTINGATRRTCGKIIIWLLLMLLFLLSLLSTIMQHDTTKCYLLIFIIDILNNTDQKSN